MQPQHLHRYTFLHDSVISHPLHFSALCDKIGSEVSGRMMNELMELRDCPWEDWLNCQEPQLSHYYEPEAGLFIAESPNVIERALHAGYEPVSWLIDKAEFTPQVQQLIADSADVPVYLADTTVLNSIRGLHLTRGVLCAMRRRDPCIQPDMLSGMQRIALLENIMNPTNLGAVFRSAAALSIDAVLLLPASAWGRSFRFRGQSFRMRRMPQKQSAVCAKRAGAAQRWH